MVRAEEALSAVKTVHIHGMQDFESFQYLERLGKAQHLAVKRSTVAGWYCTIGPAYQGKSVPLSFLLISYIDDNVNSPLTDEFCRSLDIRVYGVQLDCHLSFLPLIGLGVGLDNLILYSAFAMAFWFGTKFAMDAESFGDERFLRVFFGVMSGAIAIGQALPRVAEIDDCRTTAFKVSA